jgi:hypothetical protein
MITQMRSQNMATERVKAENENKKSQPQTDDKK